MKRITRLLAALLAMLIMLQLTAPGVSVSAADDATLLNTYGNLFGYTGTCINYNQMKDSNTMAFLKKHYNSITLENEMKPDAILQSWSKQLISVSEAKALGYYIPSNYTESTVPKLNFSTLDAVLKICAENGLKMRAHTLVWHSQTPAFFFKSAYSDSGSLVSKSVMNARMEFYIKTVMNHVYNSPYGHVVYTWDVVNEYITNQTSDKSNWVAIYGEQGTNAEFVKNAFTFADQALKSLGLQDQVTLMYNDYNTYMNANDIVKLINYVNGSGKVCDGVGMQSHVGTTFPSASYYKSAIQTFMNAGFEIHITELDVSNTSNQDQLKYYYDIMTGILDCKKAGGKITGITWWGLYDSVSWIADKGEPLLFSGLNQPKDDFYKVIQAYTDAGFSIGGSGDNGGNGGGNEGDDGNTSPASAYIHNFGVNGKYSSFYTISGNLSTSKGSITVDGQTISQCLKMESSTNISFNAPAAGKLKLVFGGSTDASGKKVKIDGTGYAVGSDNTLTVDLSAGSHSITKGDAINLFYMSYTTNGSTGGNQGGNTSPEVTPTDGNVNLGSANAGSYNSSTGTLNLNDTLQVRLDLPQTATSGQNIKVTMRTKDNGGTGFRVYASTNGIDSASNIFASSSADISKEFSFTLTVTGNCDYLVVKGPDYQTNIGNLDISYVKVEYQGAAGVTLANSYNIRDGKFVNNPLVTHKFIADPTCVVYNGRVYVYGTTDIVAFDSNGNVAENKYEVHTLSMISSSDLVNWRDEGFIDVKAVTGWANNSWAPSITSKVVNGVTHFYLYFANGGNGIGVLTSTSPTGPWTDPLGKALITRSLPNCGDVLWMFDPGVMVDDNGTAYIAFGGGVPDGQSANPKTGRIAQLGSDMISIVGTPQLIDAPYFFEDSEMNKINGKYVYSYCTNWEYSSAAAIAYMVSDKPLSGYQHKQLIVTNPGTTFGLWYNNHHHMFEFKGGWYLLYHTTILENMIYGTSKGYRSLNIDKLNIDSNVNISGKMSWEGISAVDTLNPYAVTNATTMAWNGGIATASDSSRNAMIVDNAESGDWIGLDNVAFGSKGADKVSFTVSATNAAGVQILTGGPSTSQGGTVVGYVSIPGSGAGYRTVTAELDSVVTGTQDLFFVFTGSSADIADWQFHGADDSHLHSYTASTTPATCDKAGKITYTCSCGDAYTETIPAPGHSYSSTTTHATCNKTGKITYTCSSCGHSYTENIPTLPHKYLDGECLNCSAVKPVYTSLDLSAASGGTVGDDTTLTVQDLLQVVIPLPKTLKAGQTLTISMMVSDSGATGFRVYGTSNALDSMTDIFLSSSADITGEFSFTLTAAKDCSSLLVKGPDYQTNIGNLNIRYIDVEFPEEEVHEHSYSSSVTTAATCDKAGVRTFTCSCG